MTPSEFPRFLSLAHALQTAVVLAWAIPALIVGLTAVAACWAAQAAWRTWRRIGKRRPILIVVVDRTGR
jgi:hypothetical protein